MPDSRRRGGVEFHSIARDTRLVPFKESRCYLYPPPPPLAQAAVMPPRPAPAPERARGADALVTSYEQYNRQMRGSR